MRKMLAAVVFVGVVLMTAGGARVSGQDGSMEDLLDGGITAYLEEFGFAPYGSRRTGEAEAGGIAREEIGLQAGRTFAIIGICDVGCSDVDLRLIIPNGSSVGDDIVGERYAVVMFAPETSGVFSFEVSIPACAAASCGWAVQAYAEGTPFSDAARRHDGDLAAGDDRYPTGELFDAYALDTSAGEILIADLRSESFRPYLMVEAPSGALWTSDGWGPDRSRVEVVVTETGRWTISVRSAEPGSTGRYALLLEARAPAGRSLLDPPVEGSLTRGDGSRAQGSGAADRAALEAFYRATGGADWTNDTNWLSDALLAEWHGVATDALGRVVSLRLEDNGLRGAIPSAVGELTGLIRPELRGNALAGEIPT